MRFSSLILLLAMVSSSCLSSCKFSGSELPQLGNLPEFKLTNQENEPVGLGDYRGKIWAADFIFTSCAGACPMLTQRMKKVQDEILKIAETRPSPPLRIVSFSVDPETDSPDRLKKYAERFQTDPDYWAFLTGPIDAVQDTVVNGFKISMGKVPRADERNSESEIQPFDVVHGEKFVLVDADGRIRGYYDSDAKGIKKLLADMKYLLEKAS